MKRGFTLIELLVVISIVALLSSVVLASLNSAREKGRLGSARYFATQVDHIAGEQAVGIFDFNECSGTVAADRSGFGNNGALTNMVPTWSAETPNTTGCSISFDGSNDYISFGGNTSLTIDVLTWSAWVKTTTDNVCNTVLSKGSTSSGGSFDFGVGDCTSTITNDLVTIVDMAGANRVAYVTTSRGEVFDGRWHHLVLVADGISYKIYLDGKVMPLSIGMGTNNGYSSVTNQTITTAGVAQRITQLNFFNGLIDGVRIFSKGLTAQEVGVIYASEKSKFELANI